MLHLVLRVAIACALTVSGVVLFVNPLNVGDFLLASFLIVMGLFAFVGVVARPVSVTSDRELLQLYFPTDGNPDHLRRQGVLFGRLALVFFVLALVWVLGCTIALIALGQVQVLGARPIVGVAVGASLFFGIGSAIAIGGYLARLWSLTQRKQ